MDGKVEVSILQWEQQREELKTLREENAVLIASTKEVKINIIDKEPTGYFQYDRWTLQNKWVAKNKEISSVILVGLDEVKQIIRGDVKEELINQMNETNQKSERTNREMQEFMNNQNSMIEKLQIDTEKKHEDRIKSLSEQVDGLKKEKATDLVKTDLEKQLLENQITNLKEKGYTKIPTMEKKWYQF